MINRTTILAFTLIGGFTVAIAQNKVRKQAAEHYSNKDYHLAAELYAKVYAGSDKPEVKAQALFLIAECNRHINDLKAAEVYYAKALKAGYKDPLAHFYLGEIRRELMRCDDAIEEYKKYQALVPSDARAEKGIISCQISKGWIERPTRHLVENLATINSTENDYSPSFEDHRKYSRLLISSNRKGAGGSSDIITGHLHSDIYETMMAKGGKWSEPKALNEPVNTPYNDASAVVSKKGDVMYYTHCSEEKGKVLACNIWVARKSGSGWGDPTPLPFESDTVSFRHPCLSPDGNTLYFASDMAGGYGGHDIWKVEFNHKAKEWGKPVNLGPEVNTPSTEAYPFIHDDGRTFYFSSTGHIGMGGLDMFVSKIENGKFGKAENLKYPLNSPKDDFGIIFEGKKERGYFTSNREGGKGGDDIYSFVLPPCMLYLEGYITEKGTAGPVANAIVYVKGDNGTYFPVKTNADGYYFTNLEREVNYTVNCETDQNTKSPDGKKLLACADKGQFSTREVECTKFRKDFVLDPYDDKTEFRLPAVHYLFDDDQLTQQGKDSLDYLYTLLISNPTLQIQLGSHTDTRGTSKYNRDLAQRRAQSCVDYLVKEKGINPDRIIAKGYGEDRPKISDKEINAVEDDEQKEALHQKNRRTTFEIKSWNFIDPKAPAKPPVVLPNVTGQEEMEE